MGKKRSTTEHGFSDPDAVPEWGDGRKLPLNISLLRRKLYQKAKREPKFRYYSLYGLISREDVLQAAWEQVRRNKGAPGPDGVSIHQIERSEGGPAAFLRELREELRRKGYQPSAVRRAYIPKPDGRQRPLGIPAVRDRVVQTAALLILEPIFEADFDACSYGFRPKRNAHQALDAIRGHINAGFRAVYDADLKGYFDTIPHDKLMRALEMRVVDRSVLRLVRLWLRAPITEPGSQEPPRRNRTGTPQGGVISPLLANIYLHWFDKFFHQETGPATWANAKLVRYADDFVILARYIGPRIETWVETVLEGRMGLTINREKTRIVDLKRTGESVDFLGFTFRYDRDLHGRDRTYLNVGPSRKALAKRRQALREATDKGKCFKPIPELIRTLNRQLAGWRNYFDYGYPRMAFRHINRYARLRLSRHLRRRSQRRYRPPKGVSQYQQFKKMGLIYL